MVKTKLKLIFKIGLSLLFLTILSIRVNWRNIFQAFSGVNLFLFILSTLIIFISSLLLAVKYYLLIKDTEISLPLNSLVKINFITRFYALFMPSVVGKEAIRWYKVTRNQSGRIFFLASTVFERLTFISILLLFGFIPLFFYTSNSAINALRMRIFPFGLLGLTFIVYGLIYYAFPSARNFSNSILTKIVPTKFKHVVSNSFIQNFNIINSSPALWGYIFGLSFIWQITFLLRLFILFKAASLPLNFIDIAWMGSLVLLLQLLPISFAGIGMREGAYAYLFTLFNLPPEKGVIVGLLFLSQMLLIAGIGGILELIEK
jgi:uncharacterized protein (TIRG00374 family)